MIEGSITTGILILGPAPLLDGSFNQATYNGLLKAQSEGIVSTIEASAGCLNSTCLASEFARMANEGIDVLFCMGFFLADTVQTYAAQFPNMKVAIVDFAFNNYSSLPNVAGIIFREDELGFLAGCTLGLLAPNSRAGAACGPPIPPILRFAHGLQNGFFHCCTDSTKCRFFRDYLSSFGDSALGIAEADYLMTVKNASAIAGVAGLTGSSSILRATQLGVMSIGVDTDEFYSTFSSQPDSVKQYLLTSMLKKADVASYTIASQVNSDAFQSGTAVFSLLLGGVDLAPCHLSCSLYSPQNNQTLQFLKNELSVGSVSSGVLGDGSFSYFESLEAGDWLLTTPANDRPGQLLGLSATDFSNTSMLIFGGRTFSSATNDLFLYSYLDDSWALLVPLSLSVPVPRSAHAAAAWKDTLIVYGGIASTGVVLSDLWMFNLTSRQWTALPQTGALPGPRQSHSLEVIGNSVFVFGGVTDTLNVVNTFSQYDLTSGAWTQITAKGPTARQGQASTSDPSTPTMYIFGGILADLSSSIVGDIWRYSTATGEWTQILPSNEGPSRSRATMVWTQERLLVFGGVSSALQNDVWTYSFRFNTWELRNTSSTSLPEPVQAQGAVRFYNPNTLRDFMFVYGGSTSGSISEDLWVYSIPDAPPLVTREFFSCSERKTFFDNSETVVLNRSAGIFPIEYMCDDYIDCKNSYDEGTQCSPSLIGIYIGFAVVAGLLAMYCIASVVVIWMHRTHPVIRASSPLFLTIVLGGCIIGLGAMTTFWGFPTAASCNLQFWLSAIAFVFVFGSLFLKSYRVWKIFSSEYRAVYMKDGQLLLFLMGLLLIDAIVCAVWSGYGDPRARLEWEPNTEGQVPRPAHYFCYSNDAAVFFWVMIGMNAVLVIVGVVLVYKTRNISDIFSESSYVALSIYNFLIVGIFIIPILQLLNDNIASEILRDGAYIAWVAAPALLITVPKFWRLNEEVDLTTELSKGSSLSPRSGDSTFSGSVAFN